MKKRSSSWKDNKVGQARWDLDNCRLGTAPPAAVDRRQGDDLSGGELTYAKVSIRQPQPFRRVGCVKNGALAGAQSHPMSIASSEFALGSEPAIVATIGTELPGED